MEQENRLISEDNINWDFVMDWIPLNLTDPVIKLMLNRPSPRPRSPSRPLVLTSRARKHFSERLFILTVSKYGRRYFCCQECHLHKGRKTREVTHFLQAIHATFDFFNAVLWNAKLLSFSSFGDSHLYYIGCDATFMSYLCGAMIKNSNKRPLH